MSGSNIVTPTAPATAAAPSLTEGSQAELSQDLAGNLRTIAAANSASGTGGIPSTARLVSAAGTTNATVAKASAGRLYHLDGYNAAAATRYLKLYNKATTPDENDTPRRTIAIPQNTAFALDWAVGMSFTAGIAYRLTTGSADADTGAVTAGDILGLNLDYA